MKFSALIATSALLVCGALAQTPPQPAPDTTMPAAILIAPAYNQLGSPRWTMVVSAVYPAKESLKLYASTTAEVFPVKATDPKTGKPFYSIQGSMRQGLHRELYSVGRFRLLVGGDVGPGFSQADPSGINVSFTSSFIATPVVALTDSVFFSVPVRMLYIPSVGWNPVVEPGIVIKIGK